MEAVPSGIRFYIFKECSSLLTDTPQVASNADSFFKFT
jgi:hypothetical protein